MNKNQLHMFTMSDHEKTIPIEFYERKVEEFSLNLFLVKMLALKLCNNGMMTLILLYDSLVL